MDWVGNYCFKNCTSLTSITIPKNVTGIWYDAFKGCTNLTTVTISANLEATGRDIFKGCDNLKNIIILDGVTVIPGGLFTNCSSIPSVTIPDSVTKIGDSAFARCTGLTNITIPDSVTTIGTTNSSISHFSVFEGCTSLTSITIPASVEKLGSAFAGCTNLEEITFAGNSPIEIDPDLFKGVTATCYYPLGNATWTPEILRNYGGTITWVGYCPEHIWDEGVVAQEPTAAAPGILRYTCTVCGETREEAIAFDSKYVRIYGNDRFQTAFKVADAMKEQLGVEKFTSVIIASGVNFADALSGSYLSAVKNAPILLSFNEVYNDQVKSYIRENMTDDGTIYILGGTGAVPASITTGLERYNVKRLAGDDRFGTNLAILEEAGVEGKDILVCTGLTFADSLSASASKLPILLVWRDLTKDQKAFLAEQEGSKLYVIGGEGAVSEKLEKQVAAYGEVTRLAGGNRFETSTLIAETFFDAPTSVVLAYGWNFPDGLCGGGLAASMNAPMLLTMERYEAAATAYAQAKGIKNSMILGGDGLIPDASVRTIFALTEETPITVK